jgi:Ca-activated chloride channel family protein
MTWASALPLLLLPALALLAGLRWWWSRRVRLARAAAGAGVAHLTPGVARGREGLRQVLLWSGLALGLVALAGPRWGASEQEVGSRGCDVLLVLDCSRSMLAKDLYPDRMEAARRKAIDLLRLAPETRLALMPFAALPVLRCPLTGDHHAIETMLRDCTPDLFPADQGYQGTAIGDAVKAGVAILGRQVERGQAILVVSDGADEDAAAVEAAARAAKDAAVRVYGLFIGDPERKMTMTINGIEQVMTADRSTLDRLATETGGVCVNARNDDGDIAVIHDHLRANVAQLPWQERRRIVGSERYQLALIPGILLIAAGALLPTRRRRR